MAITHSVEISLGRVRSPLTLSPGITVLGNVPDVQQYNVAGNNYEPDYTLTHLVLKPSLTVADPEGLIPEGEVQMTNITWTLLEDGTQTLITASTPGFTVNADGSLTVKRNCNGQIPMTLRFSGKYIDPQTNETYSVEETKLVVCEAVSARPVLTLDTSGKIPYDPVRDGQKTRKVKASLMLGGQEVPAANREFVWQKRDMDIDGQWADILPDSDPNRDVLDYDVSLSADGSELTVRLWLIGNRIDIRCYGKYSEYGNPGSVPIDSKTPVETFTCNRVIKRLKGVYLGPTEFRQGARSASTRLVVEDSKGVIPNPDEVLDIQWRTSTGKASGGVTKSAVVARGSKATIPATFLDAEYGGKMIPEFGVKDPLAPVKVKDSNGNDRILTFNGAVVVAR